LKKKKVEEKKELTNQEKEFLEVVDRFVEMNF